MGEPPHGNVTRSSARGSRSAHVRLAVVGVLAGVVTVGYLVAHRGAGAGNAPAHDPAGSATSSADAQVAAWHPTTEATRGLGGGGVHAEAGDESSGVTVRVTVTDERGAKLDGGTVRCFWGNELQPEIHDGRVEERPFTAAANPCVFTLPAGILAVAVQATVPGHAPAQEAVRDVYRVGGAWVDPADGVTWDVRLICRATPSPAMLRGRILVDGEPAVPEDLEIQLLQEPPRGTVTHEEWCRLGDRRGIVDDEAARYWVGPVSQGATGLWVTSREVQPLWLPAAALRAGEEMDLRLSRGSAARLRLVDQDTGEPLPQVLTTWEVAAAVAREGERVNYREFAREAHTDFNGECAFRGIRADTFLRLAYEGPDGATHELLAEYGAAWPLDEVREVAVPWSTSSGAWGAWPEAALPGAECAARGAGERPLGLTFRSEDGREVELDGDAGASGEWHAALPAGAWEVRAHRGAIATSGWSRVLVPLNEEVGPVHLPALERRAFDLRWSGAADLRAVEARLFAADGAPLAREALSLDAPEGACTLWVGDTPTRLSLSLTYADGALAELAQAVQPSGALVLLPAAGAVPLTLTLNGAAPRGDGRLLLRALDGTCSIATRLRGGDARVPTAPAGRFYFAYVGESEPGVVAGLADPGAPLWIAWTGTRATLPADGTPARETYVLRSIDGTCLEGAVPLGARTFSLPTAKNLEFWWGAPYAPALEER